MYIHRWWWRRRRRRLRLLKDHSDILFWLCHSVVWCNSCLCKYDLYTIHSLFRLLLLLGDDDWISDHVVENSRPVRWHPNSIRIDFHMAAKSMVSLLYVVALHRWRSERIRSARDSLDPETRWVSSIRKRPPFPETGTVLSSNLECNTIGWTFHQKWRGPSSNPIIISFMAEFYFLKPWKRLRPGRATPMYHTILAELL